MARRVAAPWILNFMKKQGNIQHPVLRPWNWRRSLTQTNTLIKHEISNAIALRRSLQLDTHDDVNSFLLFHEEVDPHGGFEQHASLPEFDVSGQGVSFGRLEPSESSNIDHGLANGLAFGIRSLMFPGVGSEVFEEQVQGLDFFPGQRPDCAMAFGLAERDPGL